MLCCAKSSNLKSSGGNEYWSGFDAMKVSVIIPTYNRAALVQEAIESVLGQSFDDYEIIVIDDGSTDATGQALERFASKIRYVWQENRGLSAARNRALGLAKGEYIALLDSDDFWPPYKLGLEVAILDTYPDVGFVFGDFHLAKTDGENYPNGLHNWFATRPIWQDIFSSWTEFDVDEVPGMPESGSKPIVYFGDIYHTSLFGPRVSPCAAMFRKSAIGDWLQFREDDPFCGDWEFFARLSHKHGVAFIDMEMAFTRSHEDAVRLTHSDLAPQLEKRVQMIRRVWASDGEFYAQHKAEVDHELGKLWGTLMKLYLKAGKRKRARSAAQEIKRLPGVIPGLQLKFFLVLAYVPGSQYLIAVFQWVRARLVPEKTNTRVSNC